MQNNLTEKNISREPSGPNETSDTHSTLLSLVKEERRITNLIIQNLQKVQDTKLFLHMGYSSMFEYCTRALGYSESCAYRRISAVKICREISEVKDKLDSGSLNLTTVSMAQSFFLTAAKELTVKNNKNYVLTKETKTEILAQIENCTKRQAELVLCAEAEKLGVSKPRSQAPEVQFITSDVALLHLRVKKNTIQKLDHIKMLRSHKNPNMSYSEAIEDMCQYMLTKIDPHQRPQAGAAQQNSNKKTQITTIEKSQSQSKSKSPSRYIPANTRNTIWLRDLGQCTYKNPNTNMRCNSKHLLQLDHIQPLFLGGNNTPQNLRLLCFSHHKMRNAEFA